MGVIDDCVDNGALHLILMPTEACNFRCTYCYESFRLKRMAPGVVRGVKNLLAARAAELHDLRLTWFGGEPLLALDVVEEILTHAHGLRQSHAGMTLHSDITTNGYLLDRSVFERLLDLGVSQYQISFDGPPEWHDRKRVLADGRGTFHRIWAHLLATREVLRDFQVTVRLHADRENHRALPEFVDGYARDFGADSRYRLFVRRLSRFGGPNDDALPILERSAGERIVRDLMSRSDEVATAPVAPLGAPSVCFAAKGNSFLVRADGRLNKCTVALDHPANQIGRLHPDGTMAVNAAKLSDWMRGLWTADIDLVQCPARGLAGSAVPAA
jgi:uncharacterized protein